MQRFVATTTLLTCCSLALCPIARAEFKDGPATLRYQNQISAIAYQAVISAVNDHPERLDGVEMRLRFRINKQGHVENVKLISGRPYRWAERRALRALSAVQFPAIPDKVLRELRMDHVTAEAHLRYPVEEERVKDKKIKTTVAGYGFGFR